MTKKLNLNILMDKLVSEQKAYSQKSLFSMAGFQGEKKNSHLGSTFVLKSSTRPPTHQFKDMNIQSELPKCTTLILVLCPVLIALFSVQELMRK